MRPYLFLLIPNMLWLSGCFFVLAALTRQMAPVYVAGVILLVGYMFAINLLGDMDNKTLAAMIDPSGATAFDVLARYWSVAQKNAQEIPLEGELLWNRAAVARRRRRRHARGLSPRFACRRSRRRARASARPSDEPRVRAGDGAASRCPLPVLDRRAGAYARMLPGLARLYLARDPAQPALPHDRARRRAAGHRQRDRRWARSTAPTPIR